MPGSAKHEQNFARKLRNLLVTIFKIPHETLESLACKCLSKIILFKDFSDILSFLKYLKTFRASSNITDYALIKSNTDRTLNVFFQIFKGLPFTITLRQRPKAVTRMLSVCLVIRLGMSVTHLGFSLS